MDLLEHEQTTFAGFWGERLGIGLLMDLLITGFFVGMFFAIRRVVRGFQVDQVQ